MVLRFCLPLALRSPEYGIQCVVDLGPWFAFDVVVGVGNVFCVVPFDPVGFEPGMTLWTAGRASPVFAMVTLGKFTYRSVEIACCRFSSCVSLGDSNRPRNKGMPVDVGLFFVFRDSDNFDIVVVANAF